MLKKEYYEKKIKEEINDEIKLIRDDVFIRLTPEDISAYDSVEPENDNTSDIEDDDVQDDDVQDDDEEEILLNRNTASTLNNSNLSFRLNRVSNASISRRSSYPRFLPPIVTNTYNSNINNVNTNTNPFASTFELPRTPTNNTPENTIVRRFNLGFR